MVKITYDLNNKKDAELVENYYWLKYQLKVLKFDILSNKDINELLESDKKLEEIYKELKDIILSFSCETDLIRIAEILNGISYSYHDYIGWIHILTYFSPRFYLNIYKKKLIEKFSNQKQCKDIIV